MAMALRVVISHISDAPDSYAEAPPRLGGGRDGAEPNVNPLSKPVQSGRTTHSPRIFTNFLERSAASIGAILARRPEAAHG